MLTVARPQTGFESVSRSECQAVADVVAAPVQRLTRHGVIVVREEHGFCVRAMMGRQAFRIVREMLQAGADPDEITEREVNERLEEEEEADG